MQPGSHNVAAEKVARALLECGATNLQAKLGVEIASRGDWHWINDKRTAEILVKPGGGQYHRGSVGRARRLMARAGWIESQRVFPLRVPKGADYTTTHGTTTKRILWKHLGIRCPTTRGERRKGRIEQNKITRPSPKLETEMTARARHTALLPELAAMVAGLGSSPTNPPRQVRRSFERPIHRERRAEQTTQEKAAEQRRALEAWEREQKERGPP
jgi:hypothetical protein